MHSRLLIYYTSDLICHDAHSLHIIIKFYFMAHRLVVVDHLIYVTRQPLRVIQLMYIRLVNIPTINSRQQTCLLGHFLPIYRILRFVTASSLPVTQPNVQYYCEVIPFRATSIRISSQLFTQQHDVEVIFQRALTISF